MNRDEWSRSERVLVWLMEQQIQSVNGGWIDAMAHRLALRGEFLKRLKDVK